MKILDFHSISRGYQNYKWVLTKADEEKIFVKQYHPERFTLQKLEKVEKTLKLQSYLRKNGFSCPKPFDFNGQYILQEENIRFVVMEYIEGNLAVPGTMTNNQLYNLGKSTGYMHRVLSSINTKTPLKEDWKPSKYEMEEKWANNWTNAQLNQHSIRVYEALVKQKEILDRIDFQLFLDCNMGWTHWDLWADNILFQSNQVSAILDFDRMRYVYPELDVSRAILSGAYSVRSGMNWLGVASFLQGYNEFLSFTARKLIRAFKLTWCQESPWWITHDINERGENPKRFFEEILWISENWDRLEEMVLDHLREVEK